MGGTFQKKRKSKKKPFIPSNADTGQDGTLKTQKEGTFREPEPTEGTANYNESLKSH